MIDGSDKEACMDSSEMCMGLNELICVLHASNLEVSVFVGIISGCQTCERSSTNVLSNPLLCGKMFRLPCDLLVHSVSTFCEMIWL